MILRPLLILLQIFFILTGALYLSFSRDLPSVETITEIKLTNPMRIYTKDEKLIGLFGSEKRKIISYDEIPETLKHAIISAEDAGFFNHSGVKFTSLLRAAYGQLTGRSLGGGGTITMQVVRNYVLSFERTYERKIREIILAFKLEDSFSKEKIFELYFNKAYLGNRNYGFAAAYQFYFGGDFSNATNSESALLAAILQRPSKTNPINDPVATKARRDLILNLMYQNGHITQKELVTSKKEDVTTKSFGPQIDIEAKYISESIREELIKKFGVSAYEDGFNVFTTIDSKKQKNAVKSLRENLYKYQRRAGWEEEAVIKDLNFNVLKMLYLPNRLFLLPKQINFEKVSEMNLSKISQILSEVPQFNNSSNAIVINIEDDLIHVLDQDLNMFQIEWNAEEFSSNGFQSFFDFLEEGSLINFKEELESYSIVQIPEAEAAFVAMSSESGEVQAYIGGFDFKRSKFDRAKKSQLMVGSSIKPFIYACAFENGLNPSSVFLDGPITLQDELLEDIWRPKNNSGDFLGPVRLRESLIDSLNLVSIKLVRYLGLDKTLECLRKYSFGESLLPENLSVALGTGTTNPLDFVENYSIFTNKGNLIESHIIDRVEDINGNIVYDPNHKYTSGKIPSVKKVLDERVAFMLADILKDTLYRTSIAKSFDLPLENLGGKSGTTNNSTSTWYAGFAGDMIIAVWVGKDNFSSLGDEEFGGTIALPIWLDFLSHSKDSIVDKPLILPEGVSVVRVNKKTGNISNTFDDSVFEFFLEENLEQLLEEAYKTDFLNVFD